MAGEGLNPEPMRGSQAGYWPLSGTSGAPSERRVARHFDPSLLTTGDAAAVVAAILGGAHIVRVHDPAAILPAVRIADAVLAAGIQQHGARG
jgi:dihydropteroate synthase